MQLLYYFGDLIIGAALFGLPIGFLIGRYFSFLEERRHKKERLAYLELAYHGWEQVTSPRLLNDRPSGFFAHIHLPKWKRKDGKLALYTEEAIEAQSRISKHAALDLPENIPVDEKLTLRAGLWRDEV